MLDTEIKYCRDLTMCYRIFSQGLHAVINSNLADQLFLNCEQLIRTSQLIADSLAQDSPGDAFVKHAEVLRAYVEFCSKQQSALEKLNELEQTNAAFRQSTEKAYMLLKSMCAEINSVISAMDNSNMLVWAQQHIHCESIQPPLVFPSSTRKVGPRSLLHSGALQKQRSGKTLVAFLFNDFFMLTTPAEPIEQLEEFRIQKTSEIHLNLYKTPLLLENIRAFQNKEMDSCSFEVRSGDVSVALRAPNRNARVFWMAQIEKAVNEYRGCCQTVKVSFIRLF
ncbi:unnamed protein product [Gongylonema pulchrum]|uniref:PH domain-containing protein n=1 Tax=Gongylonema pulchrum TaxID=637853 RepID=A0A3P6QRE0_9BILA|nr:unnamed protein product [Gongylonema pulchrum]